MDGVQEKSIQHYSSHHKILLVGEGDFSFAACLANAFELAPNIIATSQHPECKLETMHPTARANLDVLKNRGSTIMHGIDVHNMSEHPSLGHKLFDRIVFNFPHAGFYHKETDQRQLDLHKEVVRGFLKNARKMLTIGGQVHITHKTAYPFSEWKIVQLAEESSLILIEKAPFDLSQYPGYINRRGATAGLHYIRLHYNSNDDFPARQSCTFKFVKS